MVKIIKVISLLLAFAFFIYSIYFSLFGATRLNNENIIFVIPQDLNNFNLTEELYSKNMIKNISAFNFMKNKLFKKFVLKSGGYHLSTNLNSWQLLSKLNGKQDLVWINIYFCPRKEQVGEKLAESLGWNQEKLLKWNSLYKDTDYYEGVYYPGSYLIPVDDSVEDIAKRFINNFNENFSKLSDQYLSKNIKWTTGVKIASLIAREAAGRDDAKKISGIIWNRLNQDMRLQIDATMQYTLGKNKNGSWWGGVSLDEKMNDSPYNSYLHKGLPPTPICSPNLEFIEAALNPEETECIFYIHDSNRQIHCAKTYEEHKRNIVKYLN